MYDQLIEEYTIIRKRKNLSQASASEGVKVSQFTISRMETKETIPQLDKFLEMAKGIGMMVALVPFPSELPPERVEKIPEPEKPKEVDYDDWDYDEEDEV